MNPDETPLPTRARPSATAVRPGSAVQAVNDRLATLLAESAAGSEDSFSELYAQTSGRIYSRMLRLLRSPEHAADVTQETYQQVWRQATNFDPAKGSVMAWISVIARHRAVDRIRARTRLAQVETRFMQDADVEQAPDTSDEVIDRLDAVRVRQAVTRLSPIQQEALVLRYFHSRTLKEISVELRLPLGTVKTRIRDALIRLRCYVDVEDYSVTEQDPELARPA